jgi:hypothetical protein
VQAWYDNAVKAGAINPKNTSTAADVTGWQTNVAMTDNTHPDATKPSGDAWIDSIRASTTNQSEDFGRFSNAAILSWKDKQVPGSNPPKFYNDFGDIVDKPTEGGPKSQAAGFATGENIAGQAGGGGGGGGAGGGGGSSSSVSAKSKPGDMQSYWEKLIKDQGTSRYTPEGMAALEADEFARVRQQEKLQLDASRADQAQRGVRGSAMNNAAGRDIRAKAGAAIMSNRAQLQRKKIDADFQDKQAAIKNAQDYVNSMRDYILRGEGNAIQREQIAAQIRLAQMNISAQRDAMEQNYQNQTSSQFMFGG